MTPHRIASSTCRFTAAVGATALAAAVVMVPLATAASADVRTGVTAWETGDYARAIAEWRPLALAGDADAQFNLGQAYKLGRGVPQDLNQAATWFRMAADQNHLQSQDNLGLVLYEVGQRGDALPWLERSAGRGEPRAQYVLAAELYNGERISRDWPRAYALMKRASDAGLQRASAALVQMDQTIPLEQRQQGLTLAAQLETSEGQARMAAMTAATPRRPAQPATVRPTMVPPSQPGVSYTPPPIAGMATAPEVSPAAQPAATPVRVAAPARAARPAASPAAAPPSSSGGAWRVQLGAFGNRGNAEALWSRLSPRLPGAAPVYTAAGTVTRLQAGPYASRAAADAACGAIRPQACFAVSR